MSTSTSTSGAQDSPSCRLLELPAELRNNIYRFVVVRQENVDIDLDDLSSFAQPALLRTCRQIRNEASSLYYIENVFYVDARGFDHGLLAAFCKQAGTYFTEQRFTPMITLTGMSGSASWDRLVAWLQAVDRGDVDFYSCREGCEEIEDGKGICCAGYGAFEIFRKLRGEVPEAITLSVLETYKQRVEEQARGAWKWS